MKEKKAYPERQAVANKEDIKHNWDEVMCMKCGNIWHASDDEYFNISFCHNCHNSKRKYLGGEYWKKEK